MPPRFCDENSSVKTALANAPSQITNTMLSSSRPPPLKLPAPTTASLAFSFIPITPAALGDFKGISEALVRNAIPPEVTAMISSVSEHGNAPTKLSPADNWNTSCGAGRAEPEAEIGRDFSSASAEMRLAMPPELMSINELGWLPVECLPPEKLPSANRCKTSSPLSKANTLLAKVPRLGPFSSETSRTEAGTALPALVMAQTRRSVCVATAESRTSWGREFFLAGSSTPDRPT